MSSFLTYDPVRTESYPKISEGHFVDKYLPMFLNADADNVNLREEWINNVAKGPFNYVEVVATDDHDKVLFHIPPLAYPPETTYGNLNTVIQDAREKTLARSNDKFINDAISSFKDNIVAQDPPKEDLEAWKQILIRYNLYDGKKEKKGSLTSGRSTTDVIKEDW